MFQISSIVIYLFQIYQCKLYDNSVYTSEQNTFVSTTTNRGRLLDNAEKSPREIQQ